MKFSIKNYFSKCDQIRKKLRIWLHLLQSSLMENFSCMQHALGTSYKELVLSFHNLYSVGLEYHLFKFDIQWQ